ncbi:UPF0498 protein KIAA1191-like protein [Heterocephalus glaber]|uniref:Putative monooxygenase p33MONOX n=1 Tax=Heterocephalus glaber TaxID=10181 RepID=G5BMH9_HETGA|nr:UPF0498 protein KIAA1191-like protein [Heterocephalus glaber]
MSLSIGMCRQAFSCDDALENPTPMTLPPADMGSIAWKPVIPELKYQHLAKVEEGQASVSPTSVTLATATDSTDKVPVVKAKVTHVSMSSLITKQTQESIQHLSNRQGCAYKGAQKPSPMELIHAQATRMAEDPATFKPPKMDIPVMDTKKPPPRTHNLKPCDLNVLTPTGF